MTSMSITQVRSNSSDCTVQGMHGVCETLSHVNSCTRVRVRRLTTLNTLTNPPSWVCNSHGILPEEKCLNLPWQEKYAREGKVRSYMPRELFFRKMRVGRQVHSVGTAAETNDDTGRREKEANAKPGIRRISRSVNSCCQRCRPLLRK